MAKRKSNKKKKAKATARGSSAQRRRDLDFLQFPIDAKEAAWVEIRVLNAAGQLLGYVGYMLCVGAEVSSTTLETSKGDIDVFQPATEFWFSATNDAYAVSDGAQLVITKLEHVNVVTNGWSSIETAIGGSAGLINQAGELPADFIGAAGPVAWSNRPSDLENVGAGPTYGWTDEGVDWWLTVVQDDTRLVTLYWSHDGEMAYGSMGTVGPNLSYAERPEPTRIFIGYYVP